MINCKIVFQGIAYLNTMGLNLLRKTKTMILMEGTVLLYIVLDGGLEAVLKVILTVKIINLLSTHGMESHGGILSER